VGIELVSKLRLCLVFFQSKQQFINDEDFKNRSHPFPKMHFLLNFVFLQRFLK